MGRELLLTGDAIPRISHTSPCRSQQRLLLPWGLVNHLSVDHASTAHACSHSYAESHGKNVQQANVNDCWQRRCWLDRQQHHAFANSELVWCCPATCSAAGRKQPGLSPQHLTGLNLVADISKGQLEGGAIRSTEIRCRGGIAAGQGCVQAEVRSTGVVWPGLRLWHDKTHTAVLCILAWGWSCKALQQRWA